MHVHQITKHETNLLWTRHNTYAVQANAKAKQQQQKTRPTDKIRDLHFFGKHTTTSN